MMFDSVREELQTKITSGRLPRPESVAEAVIQTPAPKPISFNPPAPGASVPPKPMTSSPSMGTAAVAAAPRQKPVETADLVAPKTSPTLVGFQSNSATLPDWRIKLQNAVKTRKGGVAAEDTVNGPILPVPAVVDRKPVAVPRVTQSTAAAPKISDPRVAAAMKRIDQSRSAFLEIPRKPVVKPQPAPAKPYKFEVVTNVEMSAPAMVRPKMTPPPTLQVVEPPPPIKRETNKLPPISLRSMPASLPNIEIDEPVLEDSIHATTPNEFSGVKHIRIKAEIEETQADQAIYNESEDIEDLAQFSTRFGAGFFDLIITSFASLLILAPIAFSRGESFSLAGVLTFAGVVAIVTFFYMTICLGFYGKTMGMRLFSLELVDAVENEYPTLHQAAVSSSVFILSLIFGGVGFLTMLFNAEKRAAHDLLSGTILVREF